MQNTNAKRRIEIIDVAKAITIIFVVIGHAYASPDRPFHRCVLYAFHMPLFFFLAGMSIKLKPFTSLKEWKMFLRKNILALVVPYLIWGLIYAPFSFANAGGLLYASWNVLKKIGTSTSLWFLPCLFVSRIYVQAIVSLSGYFNVKNLPLYCGFCAVPMMIIGFNLPYFDGGCIWCMNIAFVASGFILLGAAFRRPLLILAQQNMTLLLVIFAVSCALLFTGTFLRRDELYFVAMYNGLYGDVFWFFVNSISGSMIVLTFAMILSQTALDSPSKLRLDAVKYIGRRTLGIYLLHKNILLDVIMPFVKGIVPETWPLVVPALMGTVPAMIFAVVMCLVTERYIPQLLGQFPKYEHAD